MWVQLRIRVVTASTLSTVPGTMPTVTTPLPATCPDLQEMTNIKIIYDMNPMHMGSRSVGTVATYTCDTGYTLNGGTTRTCGSDRVWSGSSPVCQGIYMKLYSAILMSITATFQLVFISCARIIMATVASIFEGITLCGNPFSL